MSEAISKMPPNAVDLENAVLGAVMLEKQAILYVSDILTEDMFYKEENKLIFKAIRKLFKNGDPIDLLTVTQTLRNCGDLEKVTPLYVTELTSRINSSDNIAIHARIVLEAYMKRALIEMGHGIMNKAFDDTEDVLDLVSEAQTVLLKATDPINAMSDKSMSVMIAETMKSLEDKMKTVQTGEASGIPVCSSEMNQVLGGWQDTNLIIVAARPGMGKTALLVSDVDTALKHGKSVGVFSLEMPSKELIERMIARRGMMSYSAIGKGKIDLSEFEKVQHIASNIMDLPLYIDDSARLTIDQFRSKAYRMKMEHGIDVIFLDYLQLMSGTNKKQSREQEISEISRGLKIVAKDLNIPIIALSQLSRAVEQRGGDKRPQLSDLRESGSIEQDADAVIFIYRPEYYGISEDEEGMPTQNKGYLLVAKNRHGGVGDVTVDAVMRSSFFGDLHDKPVEVMEAPQVIDNSVFNNATTEFDENTIEDQPF